MIHSGHEKNEGILKNKMANSFLQSLVKIGCCITEGAYTEAFETGKMSFSL